LSKNANKSFFIELFENSKVKYECLYGYELKSIPNNLINFRSMGILNPALKPTNADSPKYFIEKCEPKKSFKKIKPNKSKRDEDDDDDENYDSNEEYDEFDYNSRESSDLDVKVVKSKTITKSYYHECVKLCPAFKFNYSTSNLFVAPIKKLYSPGEHLSMYCNEGYVTPNLLNKDEHVNSFVFECSTNGKWHLLSSISKSPSYLYRIVHKEIGELPVCFSLKSLPKNDSNHGVNDLFLNNLSYSELNFRTFSMIILFCGLIFSMLLLSVGIVSYYSKCFKSRNRAQLDPLIASSPSPMDADRPMNPIEYFQQINNEANLISRSLPIPRDPQLATPPISSSTALPVFSNVLNAPQFQVGQSASPALFNLSFSRAPNLMQVESLNDLNLPSYEEAVSSANRNETNQVK
jgi:hypothetical protein